MQTYLFLDFDGVLHPGEVYLREGEPWLDSEDLALFCWAHLLEAVLLPYPDLKIIISSSWAKLYSLEVLKQKLPTTIAEKVIDTTVLYQTNRLSRGREIQFYAADHDITEWIAIDDDVFGWPEADKDKLVRCNPDIGLSYLITRQKLTNKLAGLGE